MTSRQHYVALAAAALAAAWVTPAHAAEDSDARIDLYGFAMLDMGYEANQTDPDWFDVLRPTKLPSFEDEFGGDGHTFAGVRQSRLGVKGFVPTSAGEIKTIFEFELFGTGVDAGQTTFRLRHAWGELGQWGAGQTWSPFMDPDVFPNSIEYWGPSGMAFFRNVQLRYMPMQGNDELFIALERPGASGDAGVLVGTPEIADLTGRFPYPDLSAHYRMTRDWGHVQVAGIVRWMEWDDASPTPVDSSGDATGWGINLSANLKVLEEDTVRLQVVYGEGIANYMNDATADVGATGDADVGEALPTLGVVAFFDHTWNQDWTSSVGYSLIELDNSAAQAPSAFHRGQYALINMLNHSVDNLMWGGELQWGDRENNSDGFTSDDLRFQVSVKYNFGISWGGKP
jgi:DcaP outer membrane protein